MCATSLPSNICDFDHSAIIQHAVDLLTLHVARDLSPSLIVAPGGAGIGFTIKKEFTC